MPRKYPDNVLVLNLHRKWFDMIHSEEKIEEYREITPYWLRRLFWWDNHICGWDYTSEEVCFDILFNCNAVKDGMTSEEFFGLKPKEFNQVHFDNGMKPDNIRPQMDCNISHISIGYGQEKWGAEPGKLYFIIHLNGVVYSKNV